MATFEELVRSDKPVLVDFFAEWCGPCKMMTPVLTEVASRIGNKANIIKVDIDRNPDAAKHYGIQGVPTLMIFKNGKMLWRQSGVMESSKLAEILLQFTE